MNYIKFFENFQNLKFHNYDIETILELFYELLDEGANISGNEIFIPYRNYFYPKLFDSYPNRELDIIKHKYLLPGIYYPTYFVSIRPNGKITYNHLKDIIDTLKNYVNGSENYKDSNDCLLYYALIDEFIGLETLDLETFTKHLTNEIKINNLSQNSGIIFICEKKYVNITFENILDKNNITYKKDDKGIYGILTLDEIMKYETYETPLTIKSNIKKVLLKK